MAEVNRATTNAVVNHNRRKWKIFGGEPEINCTKTTDGGISCTYDEGFITMNAIMMVVTIVLLMIITVWLIRGLTRKENPLPLTNMEAFRTIYNQRDFERVKQEGHPILGLIYAPWCSHCKTLIPHFKDAALVLQQQRRGVTMALIDGEAFPEIHKMVDIKGYPTCVQLWGDGKVDLHQPTERTTEGIELLANTMAKANEKAAK